MLEDAVAAALVRNDRHIAITGASGWIGRATLDLLERALGDQFASRVSCYGSSNRIIEFGAGRHVAQRALSALRSLDAKPVWVLHFAFQTKERAESMSESAYRSANQAISDTVLDAIERIDAEAVFVASSGAATKADDPTASAAMRLYGAVKRDDEIRFAAWASANARRAVIGRLFNLTGPYINKHDAYAIANFIRDALARRPITVQANCAVIRSYVAIRELMSLVFVLLAEPRTGVSRFDSGGEPLELVDVARSVAAALGHGSVDRARVTDPVPNRYVGDRAAYAALLARHHIRPVPLDQQIRETAPWIGIANKQTDDALNGYAGHGYGYSAVLDHRTPTETPTP